MGFGTACETSRGEEGSEPSETEENMQDVSEAEEEAVQVRDEAVKSLPSPTPLSPRARRGLKREEQRQLPCRSSHRLHVPRQMRVHMPGAGREVPLLFHRVLIRAQPQEIPEFWTE